MNTAQKLWRAVFAINRDTDGAVSTEYAFLIAFISIVAAGGMVVVGTELANYFTALGNALAGAASQS